VVPPLGGFYSASKFALEALSEALHFELSRFNVRVAIIEPGYVDTPFREKAGRYGTDDSPYDELAKQWEGSDDRLVGGKRPGPEPVAEAIADAVEGRKTELRWVVGSDSELVLGARRAMDDAEFETAMRKMLNLDW
jgi:NAD(P)-dependent dehydrogenase (short-subunit alcohol dehydrogenase family)